MAPWNGPNQLTAGSHSLPTTRRGMGRRGEGRQKAPDRHRGHGRTNEQTERHTHKAKPIHPHYAGCNDLIYN